MSKRAYKELCKKLKDKFEKPNRGMNFEAYSSVGLWVTQCGIKAKADHTNIICKILGRVPFPYQPKDRAIILKFLKKNKYKEFKKKVKL